MCQPVRRIAGAKRITGAYSVCTHHSTPHFRRTIISSEIQQRGGHHLEFLLKSQVVERPTVNDE